MSTPADRHPSLVRAELAISAVLRGGVILSASVTIAGILLRLAHLTPIHVPSRQIITELLTGAPTTLYPIPRSARAFLEGWSALDADVIIATGIILLVLLPMVRVTMTVIVFLLEKDWIYFGITLFVLAILLTGLLFGQHL